MARNVRLIDVVLAEGPDEVRSEERDTFVADGVAGPVDQAGQGI